MDAYRCFAKSNTYVRHCGQFELICLSDPDTRLSTQDKQLLIQKFRIETDRIYQADTSFHWSKYANYFAQIDDIWTVYLKKELVAFSAVSIKSGPEQIIYIDNMNIRPIPRRVFPGYSLGSMITHEILRKYLPRFGTRFSIAFRTQNPHVYKLAYSILPNGVYPRLATDGPPRDLVRCQKIVKTLASILSPTKDFNERTSVIQGAYAGCIYGNFECFTAKLPAAIGLFWKEKVRPEAGDAVLIAVCPTYWEIIAAVGSYSFVRRTYQLVTALKSIIINLPHKKSESQV